MDDIMSDDAVNRYVIAFESTHAAMASERALLGIRAVMLPTPRAISAGCGMALKFEAGDADEAREKASLAKEAHGLATLYAQIDDDFYAELEKL